MLKLVIEDDEGKQTVVPLIRDEITIGRKEGNTIRLTERNVSRRHARLTKLNGSIFVEDVASRYGTKLNGSKIDSRVQLGPNDEVLIGDYRLRLQDDTKPPVEERTHLNEIDKLQEAAGPQPVPANEQGRLVVISSNFAGQEFPLARTEMVIGRNAECDIIVDHRSISGTHAKVVRAVNRVFKVVDLKSSNGVKVNGQPYSIKELQSGDIIELGHVRFRFCSPGELWSFQVAAGFVEDISPPSNKGKLLILLAIIAALLVGVAAFFALRGSDPPPEPKPQGATTAATVPPTTSPIVTNPANRGEFDELMMQCDERANAGDFDAALEACKQAQTKDPSNKLARARYDRIIDELALKKHYDSALSYIEQNECELALVEIDSVTDENSWTARQMYKERLRDKAVGCLESGLVDGATRAIEEEDFDTAEFYITDLQEKVPRSSHLASLRDALEKAKRKKDKPTHTSKPRDPKQPAEDKKLVPAAEEAGGGSYEEAKALADKAKGLILGNPSKAAEIYEQALKIKPGNAQWRGSYAFALERAGKECDAYKQYKKAVDKLSGSAKTRAERGIERFQAKCE